MEKILFASTEEGAGKTSLIVAMASVMNKKCGFIKPLGDRLIYRMKRTWDHDTDLIASLWNMDIEPEKITLGFNHSKLRYMYKPEDLKDELQKMAGEVSRECDLLFIEGGKDFSYGSSISLDSLSLQQYFDAKLVVVIAGNNDRIMDDLLYLRNNVEKFGTRLGGVAFNKVQDVEEFEASYLPQIKGLNIPVLGVIPYKEQLTRFSVKYLADKFFAKVIAGEKGLPNEIINIFVGAMSTDESLRNPLFNKKNKLLITSGDRSDMIVAGLQGDCIGILLTNNILPPPNIVSRADEQGVPIILVTMDTYEVARQIDEIEALLTKESTEKLKLLEQLSQKYINLDLLT